MIEACNVISMSGGKDSTAMALLAIERDVPERRFLFADTGHEHPLTYEYIDYLEDKLDITIERLKADFTADLARKRGVVETKWRAEGVSEDKIQRALAVLQPTGIPMLDLCLWKGRFPSTRQRFCSEQLKHFPLDARLQELLKECNTVYSWQGVRRDESRERADLLEEEDHPQKWGLVWYRPILDWTAEQCFDMHRRHGLDPNPLYSMGMGRVGCMPCIHSRKGELREIALRFPEELARLAEWERLVSEASKRGSATWYDGRIAGRFLGTETADIDYTTHGVMAAILWSMTRRGGKQAEADEDIIATDGPVCKSIYGLCE